MELREPALASRRSKGLIVEPKTNERIQAALAPPISGISEVIPSL